MARERITASLSAVALLLACVAVGDAAETNYGTFQGKNVSFENVTEESDTDGLPLFGSPLVSGTLNYLRFTPTQFTSHAEGETGSDTTAAQLRTAVAGKEIDPGHSWGIKDIRFTESGTYGLSGTSADAAVTSVVQVTVTHVDGIDVTDVVSDPFSIPLTSDGTFVFPGETNGSWAGMLLFNVTQFIRGRGVAEGVATRVYFTVDNGLETNSYTSDSQANLAKTSAGENIGVEVTVVPEPATLSLLALGACLPLLRKRK